MPPAPPPNLADIRWFPDHGQPRNYLLALVAAPLGLLLLVAFLLGADTPLLLVGVPLLGLAVLHMQALAARGSGAWQRNDHDGHWLAYRAVWYLQLGGAVPQALRELRK